MILSNKDIVYSRLGPGVLDELEKRNPVIGEKKRRLAKHTQWLTEDIMLLLDRAYPKSDEKQLRMFFM